MKPTNQTIAKFITDFERDHFRTTDDTGANPCAMHLWNMVRHRAGLQMIGIEDLPTWNATTKRYELPEGSKLTGRPTHLKKSST